MAIDIRESLKIIKRLKVYEQILEQELVNLVDLTVGDDDTILKEINEEIRQFLAIKVNERLGRPTTVVIKNNTPLPLTVSAGDPDLTGAEDFSMANPIVEALMKKYGFEPTLPLENRVAIMKIVKEEFMATKKTNSIPPPVGGPVVASTGVNIVEHSRALNNLFGK